MRLSFRISVPEFCVSRQTALNVAKDAVLSSPDRSRMVEDAVPSQSFRDCGLYPSGYIVILHH